MKTFIRDFIKCGIAGWCIEITFTALDSLRQRNMELMGHTSIWMFPIYGSAVFLKPLMKLMHSKPLIVRGISYAAMILAGEYIAGSFLTKNKVCPWNYTRSKWHVKKIVRLDYFPYWAVAGLLFEYLLNGKEAK